MSSRAKKKQSKSRDSKSNQHSSPQTSFLTPSLDLASDENLVHTLEEASTKYPSLLGNSALIGQVTSIQNESKGCKIWLSESAMVASSIAPGSIVSVSFPSLDSQFSRRFPLSLLADEPASQFGIDLGNRFTCEPGNYFALATVFSSIEVAKNGVRISSNLSSTLGYPTSGRVVFVYPIQSQFLPGVVTKDENLHSNKVKPLLASDCNELILELVYSKNRLTRTDTSISISSRTSVCFENEAVESPKTPLNQLKFSSSNTSQLTSPMFEDYAANLTHSNGFSLDQFDITEVLGDDVSKRILETHATDWLCSRFLLCGNLVTVPILSQVCTFQIVSARKLLENRANHGLENGSANDLPLVASDVVEHASDAFIVKRETKVCLRLPSKLASGTPERQGLSSVNLHCTDVKADAGDTFSKLGGLSKEYAILKDVIVSSSVNTLSCLGLRTTKGVLLHGPPGTGKTSLAQICVRDAGVNLFPVNGPEIVSQYYGESEQALHRVFESARQAAPAVVFIDELDAIAPARKDWGEELSQRMVATLLNLMDGVSRTEGVLVIAATNMPDSIEPALRRPGRLDREIEIGVPSPKQRMEILLSLLGGMEHSLLESQVENLSIATHGFVGADLAALCNEAAMVCLRRYANSRNVCNNLHSTSVLYDESFDGTVGSDSSNNANDIFGDCSDSASSPISNLVDSSQSLPSSHLREKISDNYIDGAQCGIEEECELEVSFEDFEKARMRVRPSAMREVILEVPKVRWEDVGGQREVKNQLMEAVEWPQKHQDAFKRIGTRPPTGVLLFGPPGCSKTLMARAVASEAGLNFLAVKGPELFSKWVGESEKAVRSLFAKARANAPSIIFFDEIDGLAAVRGKESDGVSVSDRVMSQLLVELDGLHQRVNVTVIAATNRPDKIDPALLRPGRFDRLLYVGPPNKADREEILSIHLRKIPCSSDVSIKDLAHLTKGLTGADISFICREAALKAMEENIDASEIRMEHLKTSIRQVQPSEVNSYQELSAKFQRLVHSTGKEEKLSTQECSSGSNWSLWRYARSAALFFR
ncbi:hypothetical protein UlMin_006415 [Ulmus minor]